MADITKTIAIIFQGQDNASSVATGLAGSLKTVGDAGGSASTKVDELAKSTNNLGDSAVSVGTLTRAMQTLAGSVVLKEFIDANVAIENFGRSMTLITGSTAGAAESLEYVRGISDLLGLELTSTADNFVSLSAAAKGTSLEGQATRDIFESVSNAMALLGKSSADTGGALTAIQQIISKGTVSSEELRGQLGERLPGAFQIAARSIGVTTEELGKLLEGGKVVAEDFLPAFAAELNKTFGDPTYVVSYTAELNRLTNSLKDLAVSAGEAGLFSAITEAVRDLTNVTKGTSSEITLLKGGFEALKNTTLAPVSDTVDQLKEAFVRAKEERDRLFPPLNEYAAESERLLRQAGEAAAQVFAADPENARLLQRQTEVRDGIAETTAALKVLGVNTQKVNADLIGAFETVASSATATGREILAGFGAALKSAANLDAINQLGGALTTAYLSGKLSADEFTAATTKLGEATQKIVDPANKVAAEIKKVADESKKAEENAAKMALELEKLASNERIKLIEANVALNVAQVEADTARIIAAFESINNTINSTGDVIGAALGALSDIAPNTDAFDVLASQLDKENALRREAFELQKKLTASQIANLDAQTQNLLRGDALIKIDGAGLQPHLEAFMWEILQAIQVRANQDGLKLLLGVP